MDPVALAKAKIAESVSAADLVGQYIKLERKGSHLWGLCPFHNEKTASFSVFNERYYCFGCKANGDVIEFIRKHLGYGFIEAIEFLGKKYSLTLPDLRRPLNQEQLEHEKQNLRLYKIMNSAAQLYKQNLKLKDNKYALEYLTGRGFQVDFIDRMNFGVVGATRDFLVQKMSENKVDFALLEQLSLCGKKDDYKYDFFRNRLMIPIYDSLGRTIAFGGRTFQDEHPKYLNSRENPLFAKSKMLYGFNYSKDAIRSQNSAIIVEGYMDCLSLMQRGITNSVACLGTALSSHQLKILKSRTSRAYLVFDGDSAGQRAMLASLKAALQVSQIEINVVVLPQNEDPDSFVRNEGVEAFSQLLDQSVNLLDFAITEELRGTAATQIPDLIQSKFIPWLLEIDDPIKVGFLTAKISDYTGVPQQTLLQTLKGLNGQHTLVQQQSKLIAAKSQNQKPVSEKQLSKKQIEFLAQLFFCQPGQVDLGHIRIMSEEQLDFDETSIQLVYRFLESLEQGLCPVDAFLRHNWILSERQQNFLQSLVHNREAYVLGREASAISGQKDQFEKLQRALQVETLRDTLKDLKRGLLDVEQSGDLHTSRLYMSQIVEINKKIVNLQRDGGQK